MATGPGANQMAVFLALDEEMVRLFEEGAPEGLVKSDHIAKTLLGYAELPLGLRCRACIVLAGFDEPGYVEWAKEAVRVADLAMQQTENPTESELALRQRAYDCLEQAKEEFEERGGYYDGQEEAEGVKDDKEDEEGSEDHDDDDDDGDLELVATCTASVAPDGSEAATTAGGDAENQTVEEKPKQQQQEKKAGPGPRTISKDSGYGGSQQER